jgi:hypothetical protein
MKPGKVILRVNCKNIKKKAYNCAAQKVNFFHDNIFLIKNEEMNVKGGIKTFGVDSV